MIVEALNAMGGQGTFKEITAYIAKNLQSELADRKTWKNSVGGVLSSNPLFESVPLPEEDNKDLKRGRGSLWILRPKQAGAPRQKRAAKQAVNLAEVPIERNEESQVDVVSSDQE